MAKFAWVCNIFFGVMLFLCYRPVEGDVTLRASASQSHPMEGHSTALTCEVRSMNRSQVIMWSKDQMSITWGDTMGQMMSSRFELIMNSVNSSGTNVTSYTLVIKDVTRDDDGRYQCQVLQENGNGFSAMASATVVLSVLFFPASGYPYCSLNGSQTFLTETELTVTCTSEVGNPQISSLWMTDDNAAPPPVYSTVESSSMVVSELRLTATHELEGVTYVCRVTSPAYAELDQTCSLGPLRILEWPIVTVRRSVSRVAEGSDVNFRCITEPRMPTVIWMTHPPIDQERLVRKDGGSTLTVKNVRADDNATYVVCRVPYKDTYEEARSVILLDESTIDRPGVAPPPSFHATSELCTPWFGAFLFTVGVNIVLCLIIVRLLVKVRRLTSKSRIIESDKGLLKGVGTEMMETTKDGILTRPGGSSNWSMASEKELRLQRRMSWRHASKEDGQHLAKPAATTYTELAPDTMEKAKASKTQPRKSKGPNPEDSDSYVTPNAHSQSKRDSEVVNVVAASPAVMSSRKTGLKLVMPSQAKTPVSKTGDNPKRKGDVRTISGSIPTGQSSAYTPLNEKVNDSISPKPTYQQLQKTPNSSQYAQKPVATPSSKKNQGKHASAKKPSAAAKDEMAGASGIYGESGSYMRYGAKDSMTESDGIKQAERKGSMMGGSASYMPAGDFRAGPSSVQINQHRSGTLTSESSTGTCDNRYESPPETPVYSTGTTDDDMGDAVYIKSPSTKGGGEKSLARGQLRGTMSSRAPMPDPIGRDQQDLDSTSTDGSYNKPYSSHHGMDPKYFILEPPDEGSYNNYGADISSDSESYQGTGTFDCSLTNKPGPKENSGPAAARKTSTASDTSYLELEDAGGEIKGYMDMTKGKPKQADVRPKIAKQVSMSDSECSSNEYYENMEGTKGAYEYSIPPSRKMVVVVEEANSNEPDITGICEAKDKPVPPMEPKQKKKGGWGLFKRL